MSEATQTQSRIRRKSRRAPLIGNPALGLAVIDEMGIDSFMKIADCSISTAYLWRREGMPLDIEFMLRQKFPYLAAWTAKLKGKATTQKGAPA